MSEEIVLVALPSIPAVVGVDIQRGVTGAAATIEVGTVTTGEPGTSAAVVNSGTTSAAVLTSSRAAGQRARKAYKAFKA